MVAKKPAETLSSQMKENAKETLNVESADILSSSTYELNLNICGGVTKIPAGSFVKLAFGFPEGYGPKDMAVTFKVFHLVDKRKVINSSWRG